MTPWTVDCQASLSMGFPKQEYWSGLPLLSPRDLLDPGIEPTSPASAGGFFTTETLGELQEIIQLFKKRERERVYQCFAEDSDSMLLSHFSHVQLCVTP